MRARRRASSSTNCSPAARPPRWCTARCIKESADAFFTESEARNLRMVAGKVLMDRNCPEFLRDTAQSGYDDSAELIGALAQPRPRSCTRSRRVSRRPRPKRNSKRAARWRARIRTCSSRATSRKTPTRSKWVDEPVPRSPQLSRHLRSLRPAAPPRGVWPLHLSRRRRPRSAWPKPARSRRTARPRTCSSAAACSTSTRPTPPHAGRARDDVGGGVVLDAADDERSAQDRAPDRPSFDRDAHVLARDDGRGEGARSRTTRSARSRRAAKRTSSCSIRQATPLLARRTARAESLEELLFAFALLGDDRAVYETYAAGNACIGGTRARRRRWNWPLSPRSTQRE